MSTPARVKLDWKWKIAHVSPEWKAVFHLPGLTDALIAHGEDIADIAKEHAPYDDRPNRDPEKPHYRDSFAVGVVDTGKRMIVHVGNRSPQSRFVEFGADATPAYHTLEGAAAIAGKGVTGVDK